MPITRAKLIKYLIAILLGNAVYFALSPYMPPAAQHADRTIGWGTLVDLWLCVLMYGLLELATSIGRGKTRDRGPRE